jgi:NAD(P)-dependent dehydrogenase (short-subunit alcohol dehydrogenase family)
MKNDLKLILGFHTLPHGGFMDAGIRGNVALITGGSTGIGRGIALALAQEGVHIAVASRSPDPQVKAEIEAYGVKCLLLKADVSQEAQIIEMVQQTIAGLGRLDFYVNNAAAHWDEWAMQLTSQAWNNSLQTNLTACALGCREAGRLFIAQGHGSILIIGSTARYAAAHKEIAYRVTKSALYAYMEALAVELAPHGIRVNLITPGGFPSKLFDKFVNDHGGKEAEEAVANQCPLRRIGKVEEIGATAVLLLSDKLSGYTTGSDYVIDGGYHLRPLELFTDQEIRQLK